MPRAGTTLWSFADGRYALRAMRVGLWGPILVMACLARPAPAQSEAPEYQIKAVMLGKIALFVEWPADRFPDSASPFVVGVLGDDPFGPWLEQALEGVDVGKHPVEVRRLRRDVQGAECHVVFISRSEARRMEQVLGTLRGARVLTISDVDAFCEDGGMVALIMHERNVRFAVNTAAAEDAGLIISARLQRVALNVYTNRLGERH